MMNPQSPERREIPPGVQVRPGAMRWRFVRSGGPGGQAVNKLSTKAELWVPVEAIEGMTPEATQRLRRLAGRRLTQADEIHLMSQQTRSREANRQAVLRRLGELVGQALVKPKRRRKTHPTAASRLRRLEQKRRRGQVKTQRQGKELEG